MPASVYSAPCKLILYSKGRDMEYFGACGLPEYVPSKSSQRTDTFLANISYSHSGLSSLILLSCVLAVAKYFPAFVCGSDNSISILYSKGRVYLKLGRKGELSKVCVVFSQTSSRLYGIILYVFVSFRMVRFLSSKIAWIECGPTCTPPPLYCISGRVYSISRSIFALG